MSQLIYLLANDGTRVPITIDGAKQSTVMQETMEDDDDNELIEIPLPTLRGPIVEKIAQFADYNATDPMGTIERPIRSTNMKELVREWYVSFIDVDQPVLFELLKAANYLSMQHLLDLCCAKLATMMKGKTPQELRAEFDLGQTLQFSQAEVKAVRENNNWCDTQHHHRVELLKREQAEDKKHCVQNQQQDVMEL